MKLPKHFIDAIGADPANCVLIVGAGLSKVGVRKGGGGLPDWDQLMQAMIAHLEDTGRCDETKIGQLQSMLSEEPPRYLEVAEEFAFAHGDDRDGYEMFLRGLLMPNDLVESEVHKLLLAIGFRGIVSFNFDRVFEKQSDKVVPIVYPELTEQMGHFKRRGFFAKIHGCITKPVRQLVLTRTSYDELRNQAAYAELLRAVLLSHQVLCVGFSLRDPDFLGILADLKDVWRENFSPLYALMLDPGQNARAEWLKQGVAILPYQDHGEVKEFFAELAALSSNGDEPKSGSVQTAKKSRIDVAAVLSDWQKAQKIEEMNGVLSVALSLAADESESEDLLYQLAGLCRADQQIHLCPQLTAVGTTACDRLALRIVANSVADDRRDNLTALKPHALHVPFHQWIVEQKEWSFAIEPVVRWLLDQEWSSVGVDLWKTFLAILNRIMSSNRRDGLDKLYLASEHIAGATGEIEKVAFASGFVRQDDSDRRWYKNWDETLVSTIQIKRAHREFESAVRAGLSPIDSLKKAASLDTALGGRGTRSCHQMAVSRLLENFTHVSFLTIHGHSSLYDPDKAKEILEALASLRDKNQQTDVLHAICWWGGRHEGLLGRNDHIKDLRKRLLIPLWWRYSSDTRLEQLSNHKLRHAERGEDMLLAGQDFLLEDMMGLHHDYDEDFREAFNQSKERYRDPTGSYLYEPRPLEELWREREFRYEMSDDCPPEIIRRVAIYRTDWERMRDGTVGWAEAKERAQELWQQRDGRREYVSAERGDYAIDNLLGAYFPAQHRVVLYRKMVEYAAAELGVDEDALMTVVYMHETVHAFSHLGRDLNGNMWEDFAIPIGDSPDERPVEAHEAIAQFYTFKLLEWLDDKRLMDAFLLLEQKCDPVYRAWRRTEDYSLEDMRRILLRLRGSTETWPPMN